jgi:hypothetical protein
MQGRLFFEGKRGEQRFFPVKFLKKVFFEDFSKDLRVTGVQPLSYHAAPSLKSSLGVL